MLKRRTKPGSSLVYVDFGTFAVASRGSGKHADYPGLYCDECMAGMYCSGFEGLLRAPRVYATPENWRRNLLIAEGGLSLTGPNYFEYGLTNPVHFSHDARP